MVVVQQLRAEVISSAVFSIREKLEEDLEENLVNATDGPGGDHVTAEAPPILMFKIASKRKNRSQVTTVVLGGPKWSWVIQGG